MMSYFWIPKSINVLKWQKQLWLIFMLISLITSVAGIDIDGAPKGNIHELLMILQGSLKFLLKGLQGFFNAYSDIMRKFSNIL